MKTPQPHLAGGSLLREHPSGLVAGTTKPAVSGPDLRTMHGDIIRLVDACAAR